MPEYTFIDQIPCDFLQAAAIDALNGAIDKMGSDGANGYEKGSAECTKNCILAGDGCKKKVTSRITAQKVPENSSYVAGARMIFSKDHETIVSITSKGACADGQQF